ncbi:hypothetical protein L218DRAFT_1005059 [Marasmius fiardii PR-910]|nr:hypothetical protein L218DRAFT_1005059 [Marasmius fiardii PR-910]
MEHRSLSRRGSTTPEVPQVIIPVPPAYVRADRKAVHELREKLEKPKKSIYVPPQKRSEDRVVQFNIEDENEELEDKSSEDKSLLDIPQEARKEGAARYMKSPPVSSRPFDKVKAIERPNIPKEQAVSRSDVVGPPREITKTVMKAPKVHPSPWENELKPQNEQEEEIPTAQVEEELATHLLRQGTHVRTQDLLAVSPSLRKIILRKIKNRSVLWYPPHLYDEWLFKTTDESTQPGEVPSEPCFMV